MPASIDRYIYNYEKRTQMRQHPLFIKISHEIDKKNYLTTEKIGFTPFIMLEANEKYQKKDKNYIMSVYDWENFYLDSGKRRVESIQKNRGRITYQHNEYYGRTLDDISAISMQLFLDLKDKYNFNQQAALNIIYIKVIDESYDEYKRLINAKVELEKNNPNHYFEISDALTNKEQGVDLFVYNRSENELIAAIQVLPENFYGFDIDPSKEEIAEILKQRHEIFKNVYDIMPEYVYSSVSGQIVGSIPRY